MNRGSEYRALMGVIVAVCAAAVVSSVVPIVEHIAGAALLGAALVWLAVTALRRERRIRARLGDPPARLASHAGGGVPELRAGPGDRTPASPAPTTRVGAARTTSAAVRGGSS